MVVAYVLPSIEVPTVVYHQGEVSSEGLLHAMIHGHTITEMDGLFMFLSEFFLMFLSADCLQIPPPSIQTLNDNVSGFMQDHITSRSLGQSVMMQKTFYICICL